MKLPSFWFRSGSLPPFASLLLALVEGVLIGLFFHYLFYRLSLPVAPFIYVSF